MPAGVTVPGTVENVDLMPTVLDIAGLPIPEAAHGQSLVPWFAANGAESAAAADGWRRKPAITEKAALAFRGPDGFASTSLIFDGWKLIKNVEPTRGLPEIELFDQLPPIVDGLTDAREQCSRQQERGEAHEREHERHRSSMPGRPRPARELPRPPTNRGIICTPRPWELFGCWTHAGRIIDGAWVLDAEC